MLKLRQDFVETISQLFLEKYCPHAFNRVLALRQSDQLEELAPRDQSRQDLSFSKAALHRCSFFDLVSQSNEGFLTLQGYFIKAALLLDRDTHPGLYEGTIEYGGASTGLEGTDGRMGDPRYSGHFNQQTPSLRTPLHTNHLMAQVTDMPSVSGGFAHLNLQSHCGPLGQTNASFCIEVDEFKFFKIIRSVLFRAHKRASVIQSVTDDLASLFE